MKNEEDEKSNFFDFLQVLSEGRDWHVMKQVSVILFTWLELTKECPLENLWSRKLKSLASNYLASFIASGGSWQSIINAFHWDSKGFEHLVSNQTHLLTISCYCATAAIFCENANQFRDTKW